MKKERTKKDVLLGLCFVFYIFFILRITVFRNSFSLFPQEHKAINIVLFKELFKVLKDEGIMTFLYLFLGNILWFVPFGAYLGVRKKDMEISLICLYALGFSLSIEILQYVFNTGISEIDDIILNTLGAFLGALGARFCEKKLKGAKK